MKRKGLDYDIDHEVNARTAELDHYIKELDKKKKELEQVKVRFKEVWRQKKELDHHQPDDSKKRENDAIKKRLEALMIEFNRTTEHIPLALGHGVHSGVGGSSQEAGDDVKMRKEKGKDVLISGGDSEEIQEVEKQCDVDTDLESIDRDAELDHSLEELDARKKETQDVTKKLKGIKREYHGQPIPTESDALEQLHKRLNESQIELDKTTYQLRLAINKVRTEVKNLMKQGDACETGGKSQG